MTNFGLNYFILMTKCIIHTPKISFFIKYFSICFVIITNFLNFGNDLRDSLFNNIVELTLKVINATNEFKTLR